MIHPGTWIIRITCCAVVCSILLSLFPDGYARGLLRISCGIFLTLAVLMPLTEISLSIPVLPQWEDLGAAEIDMGTDLARQARNQRIKEAVSAYILDKAGSLGADLHAEVEVSEEGYPLGVTLTGVVSAGAKRELEEVITKDLGIAKEDQIWIGQQIP